MQSTPTPVPTDRNAAAKSSIAIMATLACLACVFFLIAATIVLALIPVYTASKTVTVNTDSQKSKQVELLLNLGGTVEGRRRRDDVQNGVIDGASLDDSGISDLKSAMLTNLPSYVQDFEVSSTSIVEGSGRRRRGLLKRGSGKRYLRILGFIRYKDVCGRQCQLLTAAPLRTIIKALTFPSFASKRERFLLGGAVYVLVISITSVFDVSAIYPGTGSVTPSPLITTTTASVTSNMNG